MKAISGSGRLRHSSNWTSSSEVRRDTWQEVTSIPQSFSMTVVTRRVETPWRYISAMATLRERSVREPCSKRLLWPELSRTCGTFRLSLPKEVYSPLGLKPLAMAVPCLAALVGNLEVVGAFEDHGGVGEHFGNEGDAFEKGRFEERALIASSLVVSCVCPVMVGVWLDFDTSIIQPWPGTGKPDSGGRGRRRPAIWPIPLRSIGQIAGLLVIRTFTDEMLHARRNEPREHGRIRWNCPEPMESEASPRI